MKNPESPKTATVALESLNNACRDRQRLLKNSGVNAALPRQGR